MIRNQTSSVGDQLYWSRGRHGVTFGGDIRLQQFNYLSSRIRAGRFAFTGAATGGSPRMPSPISCWAFPTPAPIAFGNADKYFRAQSYDAYVNDDWRMSPELTLNLASAGNTTRRSPNCMAAW